MNSHLPKLRTLLDRAAEDICLARELFDERLQIASVSGNVFGPNLGLLDVTAREATSRHTGQFCSLALERLLVVPIGDGSARGTKAGSGSKRRVLHVCSQVHPIGGHTRAVMNWVDLDRSATHSVVLLWQEDLPIPPRLVQNVRQSGGQLHQFDAKSLIEAAQKLRALARASDLVILHVHPCDVIPVLAFASMPNRPPVALFNPGDHLFGVGISIADTVVDIRPAGQALTRARRHVPADTSLLLPLPMQQAKRSRSRPEAKRELGLTQDRIVLLSVGSDFKYRPIGELDFARLHKPILNAFPECLIIVVGAHPGRPYWHQWEQETAGRIRAIAPTPDLTTYYEAADIFLDACPFGSLTALMEAALFATPAVSWNAFPAEFQASVLRSNDVALTGTPFNFEDSDAYLAHIGELVRRVEFRHDIGARMSESISLAHSQPDWAPQAQRIYEATHSAAKHRATRVSIQSEGQSGVDLAVSVLLAAQNHLRSRSAITLIESRNKELAKQKAKLARNKRIAARYASTSWRITAPIRRLAKGCRALMATAATAFKK